MILVLQLPTETSQPSLQKVSLPIQIQRPWQSLRNAQTEKKWKEAIEVELS
jgi:hypothetical protein